MTDNVDTGDRHGPWRGIDPPTILELLLSSGRQQPPPVGGAHNTRTASPRHALSAPASPYGPAVLRPLRLQCGLVFLRGHPWGALARAVGAPGGIRHAFAVQQFRDAAEIAAANKTGSAVVQIAIDLGAVVIAYHWPSPAVPALRLDGPVLASIFLGTITRWNDAAIQKLNPQLRLPDLAILPVHRLDSSGTTYITTDYLSTVSAAWKTRVGRGKSVVWPRHSLGGVGNGGVAAAVAAHVGAVGYLQLSYAQSTHLSYGRLKEKAGTFVFPTQVTVWDAALQFPQVSPTHFSIVDAPGSVSYPLAGYSWVLLRQHPRRHARELVKLFRWMVTDGQTYAAQLNYIALPPNAQSQALHALNTIK